MSDIASIDVLYYILGMLFQNWIISISSTSLIGVRSIKFTFSGGVY